MKTSISIVLVMLLSLGFSAFAQDAKTEKFRVEGNCNMCKTRIEKAANSVEGVQSADWDVKTKMITVRFDPAKTDLHKIQMAIAKAGHDTEMHKASDEAYNELPACCKYRKDGEGDHH
jgi:mercuric ion binding protein